MIDMKRYVVRYLERDFKTDGFCHFFADFDSSHDAIAMAIHLSKSDIPCTIWDRFIGDVLYDTVDTVN